MSAKPVWAKDGPEETAPRRQRRAKTAFNRCPDRDVCRPQTAQGGTAVRSFADLGPEHLRLIASIASPGVPLANYCRNLFGFEPNPAEAAVINGYQAPDDEWAAIGRLGWDEWIARRGKAREGLPEGVAGARLASRMAGA